MTRVVECERAFDEAIEAFGRVTIAINTTAMVIKKPILTATEDEYDKIFSINSKPASFFIREAGKKPAGRGKTCTIASPLLTDYTDSSSVNPGSKAPVEHYTHAAAEESGVRGITVNAIGPGPMETPFFYGQETKESAQYNQTGASQYTKTGPTDPADTAPIVRHPVSDGWRITGQTIFANGGYTTR